jgi:hypothetical protein
MATGSGSHKEQEAKMKTQKPDTEAILAQLKDFQRETVEYVFKRMYLDQNPTTRFLVADEVGLGKTLVARGLIARIIDHLWKDIDRIDFVYICSNADIARQNINRLNITKEKDFVHASRLTLLPIMLKGMRDKKLNFVSFTPGTSFEQKSSSGMYQERALLYWLLKEPWNLTGRGPMNVLQMDVEHTGRWRKRIHEFETVNTIDEDLRNRFRKQIKKRKDLANRFQKLCWIYGNSNHRETKDERKERVSVIGELRHELALSCLKALEPDFIIMDEFQRFRHLLNAEGDESELARTLFNYSDASTNARVLLLSATPYKMYTMDHERAQEDHHEDFLHTYQFLSNCPLETAKFSKQLKLYRDSLFHLGEGGMEQLLEHKRSLEESLRRFIVRTERLAIRADRNGMLRQLLPSKNTLSMQDIHAYTAYDQIATILKQGDVIEFWKSAPYLLNFMEKYVLKQTYEKGMLNAGISEQLADVLRRFRQAAITPSEIRRYEKIDPSNARLRALMREVIDNGAWKLLWMPPARPYYIPSRKSVFAQKSIEGFTKRLVFSAWQVVPKVIAALLSYEAERLMSKYGDPEMQNTAEAREKRRPLLRFARSQERNTGMSVLGLFYPGATLACQIDPLALSTNHDGVLRSSKEVLLAAESIVAAMLSTLTFEGATGGAEDDTWFWAAPILLDLAYNEQSTLAWLTDPSLARSWRGDNSDDASEDDSAWSDHVEEARTTIIAIHSGTMQLGRKPRDLAHVVALGALAGPGSVSLRALSRVLPDEGDGDDARIASTAIRNSAGQLALSFLSLFNSPESISLLRGIDGREPYWQRVLEYAFEGNIQSVMDEHVHFKVESEGLIGKDAEVIAEKLVKEIIPVISMRTSRLVVDDARKIGGKGLARLEDFGRIRYALRFQEESADITGEKTRQDLVRHAFNSPFHPFVLASTSIGQEGLDFHAYCHAVVHWNLPSNPVDLEQREGRVHRYKGHAIRKNVAARYSDLQLNGQRDIWRSMFDQAIADRSDNDNDLVPFWLFPIEGGAVIERHVPYLPLSRDQDRLLNLKKSLALYRMVFGQSRQEDMIKYLLNTVSEDKIDEVLDKIVIDLSPKA